MTCPCGSGQPLAACCEPYLDGKLTAPTAEALMRSRYTAHALARIPYLKATLAPEKQGEFDEAATRRWATGSTWLGLKILSATEREETATVEFVATFRSKGNTVEHRERSSFRREPADGCWYFVDGEVREPKAPADRPVKPFVRKDPKVGRNDPCPCGSGMKYKKCCGG